MINKVIDISVDYEQMGIKPSPRQTTLTTYILSDVFINDTIWKKRPAVIICPGGGYEYTSPREAEPIAMAYCNAGFHSFVLDYSIAPSAWPAPTTELSKAIMYVREHADEFNIDADKIFVAGFSAGGHLAASIGVHWNHPDVVKFSGAKNGENKPSGIILSYPVITGEIERSHAGTINTFVSGRDDVAPLAYLENYVTKDTPEMFIWHTFTDDVVPVISSLRIANALEANNVKFELHIYPYGGHGLSLATETIAVYPENCLPFVQDWIDFSVRWIKEFK